MNVHNDLLHHKANNTAKDLNFVMFITLSPVDCSHAKNGHGRKPMPNDKYLEMAPIFSILFSLFIGLLFSFLLTFIEEAGKNENICQKMNSTNDKQQPRFLPGPFLVLPPS